MFYYCPWLEKNILNQQYNKFLILSYSFEDTDKCLLTTKTSEGPYYLKDSIVRKDIRENQPGADLWVRLKVVDVRGCKAIPNAAVDIWHCNAFGVYSGFEGTELKDKYEQLPSVVPTNKETFLRGRQYTDENGMVDFFTIYPGWYMGRTVHIHLKIFVDSKEVLTTQLFFPQQLNYMIQTLPPYNIRPFSPTTNYNDFVLRDSHGVQGGWPKISKFGETYVATLTIGVYPDKLPHPFRELT